MIETLWLPVAEMCRELPAGDVRLIAEREPIAAGRCNGPTMSRLRLRLLAGSLATLAGGLPMALTPPAQAKSGAMLTPLLTALYPGQPRDVQLWVLPIIDAAGRQLVPAPPPGTRPVLVLRSRQTGEIVRFAGTALSSGEGSVPSTVRVTVPVRATAQTWSISVDAAGRTYPVPMELPLEVTQTATRAGRGGGVVPAWPFGLAVALAGAAGAALIARRLRGAHDPDLAPPRSVG